MKTEKKQAAIIELIKLTSMQEEQINTMVSILLASISQPSVNDSSSNIKADKIKQKVLSDEFLKRFAPPFDSLFSYEEIQELISYYKSDAMKKYFKNSMVLIGPMQMAYREIAEEVLG